MTGVDLGFIIYSCAILLLGLYYGKHFGEDIWRCCRYRKLKVKRWFKLEKRKRKAILIDR